MLNPEVEKFPAPKSNIHHIGHTWDDPKRDVTWQQVIGKHTFNTKVVMLLPDSPTLHPALRATLMDDTQYYWVKDLPLSELCKPIFLQAFIKRGQVHAVSCNTCLGIDNAAAMTPDGYLHLLVDKFTYQELELSGKLSSHILRKPRDRFVLKVNTQDENFRPGKPYYERVTSALSHHDLTFTLRMSWVPNSEGVCPSSLAKYFHDLSYEVEEHQSCVSQNIVPEVSMPQLPDVTMETNEFEPEGILEWIGCQALGIHLREEADVESTLAAPESHTVVSPLNVTHCTGFFTPACIVSLIEDIRAWLQEKTPLAVPWVSVTVYGPPDSPVNWGHQEHSYRTNGDNFYTLVVHREFVRIFKISGTLKPLRSVPKSNLKK